MSHETIKVCIAVGFVAVCLILAALSRRRYRQLDQLEAEEKPLAATIDQPGMDEDFAHRLDAGPEGVRTRARDTGAI